MITKSQLKLILLILLHTNFRMALIKKRNNENVGEGVEKLEPSYIAGGKVKWYSCSGKQSGSPPKG